MKVVILTTLLLVATSSLYAQAPLTEPLSIVAKCQLYTSTCDTDFPVLIYNKEGILLATLTIPKDNEVAIISDTTGRYKEFHEYRGNVTLRSIYCGDVVPDSGRSAHLLFTSAPLQLDLKEAIVRVKLEE